MIVVAVVLIVVAVVARWRPRHTSERLADLCRPIDREES